MRSAAGKRRIYKKQQDLERNRKKWRVETEEIGIKVPCRHRASRGASEQRRERRLTNRREKLKEIGRQNERYQGQRGRC